MNIPFLDIKAQNESIAEELRFALDAVIADAQFILGPAVERFERAFAKYVGVQHCVGVNNGTTALHMALLAHNIGPGDEVITTAHSWISTSWAISYVGATPVFVDIHPDSYCIDPEMVEAAITPRTKAILPVHLYGQAADIVQLRRIADDHDLVLVEDAAQAHGAEFDAQRVGSFGDSACFSFYPGKNLGAFGEAGAVVTNNEEVAARIRRLRDHAQDGRHNHVEIGYNTRMEGIQGAVLDVKLKHLDHWNTARRRHARQYRDQLASTAGIRLPTVTMEEAHVWHLFVILVERGDRDAVRDALTKGGIATGVHYPTPIPLQPAYQLLGYRRGDFPVAEKVMSQSLSLPMFPELTSTQIAAVASALQAIVHRDASVLSR
jgi:dTDP-4-amino-4,6-dideoxygalactose transaminase